MRVLISDGISEDVSEAMSETVGQLEKELDNVTSMPEKVKDWVLDQIPGVVHGAMMIAAALILFFIGRKVIKWITKLVDKSLKKSKLEEGVIKFLHSCISIVLNIVLIVLLAGFLGLETTSLAALIGSAGLAIGLSLQGSLSNFAGGVLILIVKPFVIGDYIVSGAEEGTVIHIDIFYTRLLTVDNRLVVIPNGSLSNAVITNVTNETIRRVDFKVGIEYGEDIDKVKGILADIATANEKVLKDKPVDIYVDALDASSVNMGLRVWTSSADYWSVKWEILENIKKEFDKNNVSIPFNQLDVNIKQ
ncbi:MAG: mechanosensitive ion channel [Lachnospiraceae bacterium]|nr:mechanosensitive ion channel [Lachnospiraceae bacterium]